MTLEEDYNSRDYLFGRLLAVAEHLESRSLYLSNDNRMTTAERYMQKFSVSPLSTWAIIEKNLQPYRNQLRGQRPNFLKYMDSLIDQIMNLFTKEDYNDKPLSGEFFLGYHCQRSKLRNKEEKSETTETMEE